MSLCLSALIKYFLIKCLIILESQKWILIQGKSHVLVDNMFSLRQNRSSANHLVAGLIPPQSACSKGPLARH